jgi:hypothetical protein
MRTTVVAAVSAAVVMAGATSCSTGAAAEWRRLPDAPLSARTDAVVVGLGDRVLVVGGWDFICPAHADCVLPEEPLLADGVLYDATTDSWRSVAPPPFGVRHGGTTVLDDTAYLLTGCSAGPSCDAPARLLSYRPADDRWTDHGVVPGPERTSRITALDGTVLLYTNGTALGRAPDLRFDPRDSSWTELPPDPLPPAYDRFMAPVGDQLVLAAAPQPAPGSNEGPRQLFARLDLASGTWSALPDAPGSAYLLVPSDDGPLLVGHFGQDRSTWLLDPGSWTWSALPEHGNDLGLSGVLDRDRATYYGVGTFGMEGASRQPVVYDSVTDAFVTIPPPPRPEGVFGGSATSLGRDLFLFGGQRWTDDDRTEGELVGDAWLWTAPVD